MLDPDNLAKDVKSVNSRVEVLVNELRKTNILVHDLGKSIEKLGKDNVFIKTTLEETKYTNDQIKFDLRELMVPPKAILACLKSIRLLIGMSLLVGVMLLVSRYYNGIWSWFHSLMG